MRNENCDLVLSKNSFKHMRVTIFFSLLSGFFLLSAQKALNQTSYELYGGFQTSPHSVVSGFFPIDENSLEELKFTAGWDGKSFKMPPYYGVRFTKWQSQSGWGIDFTHSKAYADNKTKENAGFKMLQFTDGLNNLTFHKQNRFQQSVSGFRPYYGFGAGVIIPHVELQVSDSAPITYKYMYGGPTLAFNTGLSVPWGDDRFIFCEYKFTASWLNVNLNGGGTMNTRIFTNALNIGLGFQF